MQRGFFKYLEEPLQAPGRIPEDQVNIHFPMQMEEGGHFILMLRNSQPPGQHIGMKYSKNANNIAGNQDKRWRFKDESFNPNYFTRLAVKITLQYT